MKSGKNWQLEVSLDKKRKELALEVSPDEKNWQLEVSPDKKRKELAFEDKPR